MEAGKPITSLREDAFERDVFATHLASFLCLPKGAPSIVVGIEGAWGVGKTSCINLIKEIVSKSKPCPIIVDFSPWLISTIDSVIEGFFVQLAAELGGNEHSKNAKEAAKKVLAFGKMLAPISLIPGVEPWGSIVANVLKTVSGATKAGASLADLSLQKRKNELQEHLAKIDKPIIVVIDDVDRLPPEQVRIIFQMLKTVGDFERVSYLIAYSPEPVKKALSYGRVYDGRAYLEKIVQVSYPIPRLGYLHRYKYLETRLEALMRDLGIRLSEDEQKILTAAFDNTELVRAFTAPRDVIRLCNHLRLSIKQTVGEVCVPDLIVFETLAIKFPQIAARIRRQPEAFLSDTGMDTELASMGSWINSGITKNFEDSKQGRKKSAIEILLDEEGLVGIDRERVDSLLTFLFPRMSGIHGVTHKAPDLPMRIRHRNSLLKVLHCGVTRFTFSAKTAQAFFAEPKQRAKILEDYKESGNSADWLTYLETFVGDAPLEDPIGLCDLILNEAKGTDSEPVYKSVARQIGSFFYQIMRKTRDHEMRLAMLRHLLNNRISLSVSEHMLLQFLGDYNMWKSGHFFPILEVSQIPPELRTFTYEELYAAKDIWLQTVREVVRTEDLVSTQRDPLSIMYRWGQLNDNDYGEVQQYVDSRIVQPDWLARFVRMFNIETQAGEILPFLSEIAEFKVHLVENLPEDEQAQKLAAYLDMILKKKAEGAKEVDIGMAKKGD